MALIIRQYQTLPTVQLYRYVHALQICYVSREIAV